MFLGGRIPDGKNHSVHIISHHKNSPGKILVEAISPLGTKGNSKQQQQQKDQL